MDKKTALKHIIQFLDDETYVEDIPKVDAIFVFGHIDPRIAEHAALLYNLKKSTRIILTGKGRKEIPGYESEAAYYSDILLAQGVFEPAIILEEQSMNSLQNVVFGIEHCEKIAFSPRSLILVAMPPLLRRARAIFEKQFPAITTYGSSFKMPFEEYEKWAGRMLEEFDRFEEYAEKGDIAPVAIPDVVREAIEFLKRNNV